MGGQQFGRYVIVERLGQGGMGVVYKAYDPELDRRVALKVVRVEQGEEGTGPPRELRERLLREAQAMARLSHPNVIAVHDVGSLGLDVFVAMELVDGPVLTAWLRERARTWREILDVFTQAGRGLAAAHRAGLVHRDFKPDNVMVGADGRVRVLDFGLARQHGASEPRPVFEPDPREAQDDLTRTGAVVGTPAYMSPEQHRGQPVDPRSDQFSFCVGLYRALVGQRPFPGEGRDEISQAVMAGRLRDPPVGKLRGFVWRALRRGLATRPEDRFPSMDALLAALARDPLRFALPAAAGVAALAVIATAAIALRPEPPRCAGAEARLAGVWDAARQGEVERAFGATGAPFAADAWRATRGRLDAHAGALTAMRREACEATQVRGEQSPELLDLRVACLDERLGELRALVDLLAHADRALVERAPLSASGLPAAAVCADTRWLTDRDRPPRDPAERARVDEIQRGAAEAEALLLAGRFRAALDRARALAPAATLIGHRPTEARLLLSLGDLTGRNGDPGAAEEILTQALRAALAGRDLRLAATIAIRRGVVLGRDLANPARGLAALADAAALVEGAGGDPSIEARVAAAEGQILAAAGRDAEATPRLRRAVALLATTEGAQGVDYASALNDLGGNLRSLGHYPEAQQALAQALSIREAALGGLHPFVASTVLNLGNLHYSQGQHAAAALDYQRALAIRERALGNAHPLVADSLAAIATNQIALGQIEAAVASLGRALDIYPQGGADAARVHHIRGDALRELGRLDDALASYARALAIKERVHGPDHAEVALTVYAIAEIFREQGRHADALPRYERALAIDRKTRGEESIELAYDLTGVGATLVDLGRPAEALAPLERARSLLARPGARPSDVAATDFELARALWSGGRDRPRAVALARGARAAFGAERAAAKVEAWLAQHAK